MTRDIGLAHLTLLSLTPPELVETAAAAGFDFVGLRVKPVTATEPMYPLQVDSPMMRETLLRLDNTGLSVRDIDFLPLTHNTTSDDWRPVLEVGAALGAQALTVAGSDPDRSRLLDTLGRLAADAAKYGIRPLLEPISYQPVYRVSDAAEIARATGAALMLDPLHLQRGGTDFAEVRALNSDLVPIVQLCDAPLQGPRGSGRIEALQHEARTQRLLIGEGSLPLAGLLEATPPLVPVSVEIPNSTLQASLSPLELAIRARHTTRTLVSQLDRYSAPRADGFRPKGKDD